MFVTFLNSSLQTKNGRLNTYISCCCLTKLPKNLKETLKGIDTQRAALKWYNLIKKGLFKTLKKQTELVLEEFNSGTVKKK